MISPEHDKKLFLIDAYALIFRAYFAFAKNPRINSLGQNTSAAFGFTNALTVTVTGLIAVAHAPVPAPT